MKAFLFTVILTGWAAAYAQNPFAKYGYEPKIATLSQGKYNEFFDQDTIVQIGQALFNTKSRKLVGFVEYDTLYSEATLEPDIVSRWLSPDPLAAEYTSWSPYNFVKDNPIMYIDPDGRKVTFTSTKDDNGNTIHTLHLTMSIINLDSRLDDGSIDFNKFRDELNSSLSRAFNNSFDDGKVVFKITTEINVVESLSEVKPDDHLLVIAPFDQFDVVGEANDLGNDNVAYLNSYYFKAATFFGRIFERNLKDLAGTGSHELGHLFGLEHVISSLGNLMNRFNDLFEGENVTQEQMQTILDNFNNGMFDDLPNPVEQREVNGKEILIPRNNTISVDDDELEENASRKQ